MMIEPMPSPREDNVSEIVLDETRDYKTFYKLFLGLGLFVVGVIFALLGGYLQSVIWHVGEYRIPLSAILLVIFLVVLIRGYTILYNTRWAGSSVWFGWLFASVLLGTTVGGTDLLLSRSLPAGIYFFGGFVLGLIMINIPLRKKKEAPIEDSL